MKVAVILVAAGSGVRLGAAMPKAFAPLCGEPLMAHALRGVLGCAEVGHVVIVAPASHLDQSRAAAGLSRVDDHSRVAADHPRVDADHSRVDADHPCVDVVAGGADRSASVQAGLAALHHDDGIVLVHDAARCLAPSDLFDRVVRTVRAGHSAVVPGLALTDTVKVVDDQGFVLATPERESLRAIQTPQGFLREVLESAHAYARAVVASAIDAGFVERIATDDAGFVERIATDDAGFVERIATDDAGFVERIATDDAGLVERIGGQVCVVEGDHRALKITTPADLAVATLMLQDGQYAG